MDPAPRTSFLTPTTERLLGMIPPFARQATEIQATFDALAAELDRLDAKVSEVRNGLFPQTASGGTPVHPHLALVLAEPSLVSLWRLGELAGSTAVDSKGANDLTYQGGFTLGQPGLLSDSDTAVAFDGSTGTALGASGLNQAGDWSVAAWFKPDSVTDTRSIAGSGETGGTFAHNYLIYTDGAAAAVIYGDSTSGYTSVTGGVVTVGSRHQIFGTYVDATKTLTLFLNGVQVGQITGAVEPPSTGGTFSIGTNNAGFDNFFDGVIDEVALYSAALPATKIAAQYAARAAVSVGDYVALHETVLGLPVAPEGLTVEQRRDAVVARFRRRKTAGTGSDWVQRLNEEFAGQASYSEHVEVGDRPVNLIPNPSLETNLTGWSGGGAPARHAAAAVYGAFGLRMTGSGAADGFVLDGFTTVPVAPGLPYQIGAYVKAMPAGRSVRMGIQWLNAGGGFAGATSMTPYSAALGRRTASFVSPAGSAWANVTFNADATSVGEVFDFDGFDLVQTDDPVGYFDGDQPGSEWLGTPHASHSRAFADSPPANTVRITVPGPEFALAADVERRARPFTPAWVDIEVAYAGGFLIGISDVGEEPI